MAQPSPKRFLCPADFVWDDVVIPALKEDWGRRGDITSRAIFDPDHICTARFVAREGGVICGVRAIECAMKANGKNTGKNIDVRHHVQDGERVEQGRVIATVTGPVIGVLEAERVALNILSHLSAIATKTSKYADVIAALGDKSKAKICCTRKTTPLLRSLEKYAVQCGGGVNHRFGLDDAVLIKDNHIAVAGDICAAIDKIRDVVGHMVKIEVEVDNLHQLSLILDKMQDKKIDAVLLDNMTAQELKQAVEMVNGRFILEASGGVNLENLKSIALSGVDLISCGALTHSIQNFDIGLDIDS